MQGVYSLCDKDGLTFKDKKSIYHHNKTHYQNEKKMYLVAFAIEVFLPREISKFTTSRTNMVASSWNTIILLCYMWQLIQDHSLENKIQGRISEIELKGSCRSLRPLRRNRKQIGQTLT